MSEDEIGHNADLYFIFVSQDTSQNKINITRQSQKMLYFFKSKIKVFSLIRRCFNDPLFITKRVRRLQAEILVPSAKGVVLDIGCGTRPYKDLLSKEVIRYIGLDNPGTMQPEVEPDIGGSGSSLPIKDGTVDTVLCFEVLNYIADPFNFFREIERILRPSGTIILSCPFMRGATNEPEDFFRYTPQGLKHLAKYSGLQVESISSCGGLWSMVGQRISSAIAQKAKIKKSRRWHYIWKCGVVQSIAIFFEYLWFWPDESLHCLMWGKKNNF